ncbi:uncharacterized protein LOC129598141 [Paramacrobiotus metropolitanus]|uniref:uncharacterized protein LOC129598141 n=1 Tax=Paramacrobiotus metropolitanus TaxID=2943436 RepID=UPI002445A649|nr:uncharacterized protein LOC129598141 [Paramacrobiotus metropolitanus]
MTFFAPARRIVLSAALVSAHVLILAVDWIDFFVNGTADYPSACARLKYNPVTVSREAVLNIAHTYFPEYSAFLQSVYGYHSSLFLEEYILSSESGVQQGDPLGPLLFCLVLHMLVITLTTELNAWFLDDGTLGGSPASVLDNFERIVAQANSIGLEINIAKCELFVCGGSESAQQEVIADFIVRHPQLRVLSDSTFTLLGAPVLDDAIGPALTEKAATLTTVCERLQLLPRHHALYLLKHCLGAPKVIYMLRCCNAWRYPQKLYEIDEKLRFCFQSLCNVKTTHDDYPCWRQATLPVCRGGIGIRRSEELALPAFLASIHSVTDLMSLMLPGHAAVDLTDAQDLWKKNACLPDLPEANFRKQQKVWDLPLCNVSLSTLLEVYRNDEVNRARLLAQSKPEAGIWLNALPSAHIGNLLDDDTLKISVGLRLGVAICEPHDCLKCHKHVDKYGHHGLSCAFSAGRHPRHGALNSIVCRSFVSAGIPAKLEPRGTSHTSDRRPRWLHNLCLAERDVSCMGCHLCGHRRAFPR